MIRGVIGFYVKLVFLLRGGLNGLTDWLAHADRRIVKVALRKYGASVGAGTNIMPGLTLDNAANDFSNLAIGRDCYIGKGVFFDLAEKITIGDQVAVSARVIFLTHGDPGGTRPLAEYVPRKTGPIVVQFGAWVGAAAVLLPGVTIGERSVVGAGAVVADDVPGLTVVAGVPAKPIGHLGNRRDTRG